MSRKRRRRKVKRIVSTLDYVVESALGQHVFLPVDPPIYRHVIDNYGQISKRSVLRSVKKLTEMGRLIRAPLDPDSSWHVNGCGNGGGIIEDGIPSYRLRKRTIARRP